MFCGNCGASVSDTAKFCLSCGNALTPAEPEVQPAPTEAAPISPTQPKRSKKKLVIWLIIAALVVSIGATAGYLLLNKNTPRKVVYAALDAIYGADADALFDLLPEALLEEEFGGRLGQKTAKAELQEALDDLLSSYHEYYDEPEIEYTVVDVQKLTGTALEELQDQYEDDFNCTVTAAKEVTVRFTITDDDDNYLTSAAIYTLVKIDGTWYFDYLYLRYAI